MELFNRYEILGVKETAEPGAIKSAFQAMAMKYHPDRVADHMKKKSEDIFKMISEAYEVLSDPEKRKKYDEWLKKTKPDQTANQADTDSPPVVNVDRDYFKFENLRPGVPASDILTVLNQGGETLIGTIGADKPWARLSETVINASDYQEIEITVDTGSLPPGVSDCAIIEIDTNGGKRTVTVDVSSASDFAFLVYSYWLVLKSWLKPFWPRILGVVSLLSFCLILYFSSRSPAVIETNEPQETIAVVRETPKPYIPKPEDFQGEWYVYSSLYNAIVLSFIPVEGHLEGRIVVSGIIGKIKGEISENGELVFKIVSYEDVFKDLTGRSADFKKFLSFTFKVRLKGDLIELTEPQHLAFSKINDQSDACLMNALVFTSAGVDNLQTLGVVYGIEFEKVWEAVLEVFKNEREKIRFEDKEEKIIVTYTTEHSSLLGDYVHKYVVLFHPEGETTEVRVIQFRYEKGFVESDFSSVQDPVYTTDVYFFVPLEKKLRKTAGKNYFVIERLYVRQGFISRKVDDLMANFLPVY